MYKVGQPMPGVTAAGYTDALFDGPYGIGAEHSQHGRRSTMCPSCWLNSNPPLPGESAPRRVDPRAQRRLCTLVVATAVVGINRRKASTGQRRVADDAVHGARLA